jgi:hypothetical protein
MSSTPVNQKGIDMTLFCRKKSVLSWALLCGLLFGTESPAQSGPVDIRSAVMAATAEARPRPRLLVQDQAAFDRLIHHIVHSEEDSLWRKIYRERVLARSGIMESALSYKVTGDRAHLEAVKKQIEEWCGSDREWEPYYMLESSRRTRSLAFLYDFLYEELDIPWRGGGQTYRDLVKTAIIDKGLRPYLVQHQRGHPALTNGFSNWNHQMNAGAVSGALAVLEEDTSTLVQEVLEKAVPSLQLGIRALEPNGFWDEGVSYFLTVVLNPVAETLLSMENSLGTDFGLSDSEGLKSSGSFPMYVTGPTGFPLGYGDTHSQRKRWASGGGLFWLGQRFHQPAYIQDELAVLKRSLQGSGWSTLFFMPFEFSPEEGLCNQLAPDVFYGEAGTAGLQSQFAIFRSAWNDENAVFGSLKGGHSADNHRHLDLGTFEIHALGEQWTVELGYGSWLDSDYRPDPEIPVAAADMFRDYGFFMDAGEAGSRWTVYNVSSRSHSVPLINNRNQQIYVPTVFQKYASTPDQAFATLDLTAAYSGQGADQVKRGLKMLDGRRAFLIQDEYRILSPQHIAWGMSTDAEIEISEEGLHAVLTKNGKRMHLKILESETTPENARFSWRVPQIGTDIQTPEDYLLKGRWRSRFSNRRVNLAQAEAVLIRNRSPGFKRLLIEVPDACGEITLPVLIFPETESVSVPPVARLDQW